MCLKPCRIRDCLNFHSLITLVLSLECFGLVLSAVVILKVTPDLLRGYHASPEAISGVLVTVIGILFLSNILCLMGVCSGSWIITIPNLVVRLIVLVGCVGDMLYWIAILGFSSSSIAPVVMWHLVLFHMIGVIFILVLKGCFYLRRNRGVTDAKTGAIPCTEIWAQAAQRY